MSLQDQTTAYLRRLTYRTAAKSNDITQRVEELKTTPLFTPNVQHALAEKYPQSQGIYKQYALLAQRLSPIPDYDETERDTNDSALPCSHRLIAIMLGRWLLAQRHIDILN